MHRLSNLLFILFVFSLSGCLVDGPKERPTDAHQSPGVSDPHYFLISGKVVKGATEGARISVYPFIGGLIAEEVIGQTFSEVDGFYQLSIPRKYYGQSAVIIAQLNDSWMACDLISGCGLQEFGGKVQLENSQLTLTLGVPTLFESNHFNLTVLTHLAFEKAKSELAFIHEMENGVADLTARIKLSNSNASVASLLGIVDHLPTHKILDITNQSERSSAKSSVLHYSLLNGAVVDAAMKVYGTSDYAAVLEQLADQLKSKGIPGVAPAGVLEVSQVDVIDALIQSYQYLQITDDVSYSEQLSELFAARALYVNDPAAPHERGISSETVSMTSLEKAKRMVESVREVALSLDLRKLVELSNLSGFVGGGVGEALEGFGVVVDTSELISSDKTGQVLTVLSISVRAALDALIAYYADGLVPEKVNGINVYHSIHNRRHSILINDEIDACEEEVDECFMPVNLQFSLELSSLGGSGAVSLLEIKGLDASFAGAIGDGGYQFFFADVDTRVKIGKLVLREGTDALAGQTLIDIQDWNFFVPFQIISSNTGGKVGLSGVIESDGAALVVVMQESAETITVSDTATETVSAQSIELYELNKFNLSGSFSIDTNSEDNFFAALNVIQERAPFSGRAVYKTSSKIVCHLEDDAQCETLEEESKIEGETVDSFVRLSASVGYKASLKGIKTPVLMQVSGSRLSPTLNNISTLKVSYPGYALALNGKFNNNGGITSLDAINLDGMHLYFDSVNGKRVGAVETPAKEKVADIVDMGQWVKVHYLDGDFESF